MVWKDLIRITLDILKYFFTFECVCSIVLFIFSLFGDVPISTFKLVVIALFFMFFGVISIFWSVGILVLMINFITNRLANYRIKTVNVEIKYKEYYRDVLKLKSPILISIVDDYNVLEKDLVAELLHLKLHDVIQITNDEIIVLNTNFELSTLDSFIINNIFLNGKIKVKQKEIELIASEEAKRLNLFEYRENNEKKFRIKNKIMRAIGYFITLLSIVVATKNAGYGIIIFLITLFIFVFYDFYVLHFRSLKNGFVRTKEGEKLNKKIEGLKNYIRDYSMLNERNIEEIELWEDYLVYSVIWGQNTKIVEEYEKYIEMEDEDSII